MTSTKQQRRMDREVREAVNREMRSSFRMLIVDRIASLLTTIVKYGAVCGTIAYMAYALAGRTTAVQIDTVIKVFASRWVYMAIIAIGGAGCAVKGASLKKRIKTISDQKKILEELIDPGRSTSGMKPDGTPPRKG